MSTNTLIRSLLFATLCIAVTACSYKKNTGTVDDTACKGYLLHTLEDFQQAKTKAFIYKIDSIRSSLSELSPGCQSTFYGVKIWYYMHTDSKFDSALMYTDSNEVLYRSGKQEQNKTLNYAGVYSDRGEIYYLMENFDSAYTNYFRASVLAGQSKDTCTQVGLCYGLGMITYKQKKYRESANYFKTTFTSTQACRTSSANLMQEVLDNIALCYQKLNMPDSALYYYDSTIRFIQKNKSKFSLPLFAEKGIGVVYGNIGSIFLSSGNLDSAIYYLQKSYGINIRRTYDNGDALLAHIKLAGAWLKKNDLPAFENAMQEINKEFDTIEYTPTTLRDWNNLTYKYHKQKGNAVEALRHHEVYTLMQDSISQAEQKQLRADVDKAFKQKQQTYAITLLQKENKLNSLYLWLTIVVLIMVVIVLVQIYVTYRNSRKNIARLTELNMAISHEKARVERRNKEKDRILDVVAHDLRNPVSGILHLATEMQSENAADWDNENVMRMIQRASESGMALINELLGYTNIVNTPALMNTTDLVSLVNDTLQLLQFKAKEKKQQLLSQLPDTPVMVNINEQQIVRVINNLVGNAIKFSREGTEIWVLVEQRSGLAIISVKDNGIGIPAKISNHVFDMFTDARRAGTDGERSYGLGLSICKEIINAHNGKIWFVSEEGKGTTFFLELPID